MRVLVLGGGGQVARAVASTAPPQHQLVVKSRQDVDVSDEDALSRTLGEGHFDWVVNGAAYTAVDLAEKEAELAQRINGAAVGSIARAAAAAGSRLVHLSTDFVFDGTSSRAYRPSDPVHPLSVYGASKLAGERALLDHGGDGIIIRTAWVYASTGKNFVLTMLRLMRERDEVRVVSDQLGTPTWATGIAHMLWGFMAAGPGGGIYHWTDLGVSSWYDFALAIQEEALARGLLTRAVPVIPIATSSYPTPARRPAFSVLNTESARSVVPLLPRHWRQNLRLMLDELRAA